MEYGIGELFKRISDNLEKKANMALSDSDITLSQSHMLLVLRKAEGGESTLKDMEKHFRLAQSCIAGIAIRLEKKGLITSYTEESDKRIKHIKITEEGKKLAETTEEKIKAHDQQLLSVFSEEEKKSFRALLEKMLGSIED